MNSIEEIHPLPWKVVYSKRCVEWHAKSSPRIIDANGCLVVDMPQHVGHPGEYDEVADLTALTIISCVNELEEKRDVEI